MSFLLKTLLGIGGIVLYKLFSEDQNNHGDGSLDRHGLNRENRDREPVTRTTAPSYEHRSRQPNAETRTGLNRVYENSTPINAPEAAPSYDHRSRQPNAEIGTGVRHGIYENSTPIRAPEPATSYDHPSPQPKAEIRTGFHHELVYKNSTPIKAPEGVKRTPHEVSPPPSSSRVPPSSVKPTLSPAPSSDSTNSEAKTKYVLVQKDVSPIYVIPEDFKDLIKKDIVPGVLKKPLSPSTYRDYFAALLYAEDFYIEKWSNFQLFNVTLELHEAAIYDKPKKNKKFEESDKKDEKTFVVFEIESVRERRPFLMSRDFVFLQPSGCQVEPFQGELDEQEKLVSVLQQVDVVISTLAYPQVLDQLKLIEAIKVAGNIKRFLPSDFGCEEDRVTALPPFQTFLNKKKKIRRAIEEAGIPYTFVSANCFGAYFVNYLLHPHDEREDISVYGSGEAKAVLNFEEDIAAYTIKVANDPRTCNRIVIYRPPRNIVSQLELISLWEKKKGRNFKKVHVPEEDIVKLSETLPEPHNIPVSILHCIFVKGDLMSFELGENENEIEASSLYPDMEYTTIDQLLDIFLLDSPKPQLAAFE